MSLEESETEEKQTTGQPWHTKPLQQERSQIQSVKAALEATYSCEGCKSGWSEVMKQAIAKRLSLLGRASCPDLTL